MKRTLVALPLFFLLACGATETTSSETTAAGVTTFARWLRALIDGADTSAPIVAP